MRCAAATALARHCCCHEVAAALDGHAMRRLVTAAGDSHPEACAAAFSALGALCGAATGERPVRARRRRMFHIQLHLTPIHVQGPRGYVPPSPEQCFAAATAAAEMWACRKELTARAGSLAAALRTQCLFPLAFALQGTCTGSLRELRIAGGLAPLPVPPQGECVAAFEALGELLSGACNAHATQPQLALESLPLLLRLSCVPGAPEEYAKASVAAALALADDKPRGPMAEQQHAPSEDGVAPMPSPLALPQPAPAAARLAALTALASSIPKLPLAIGPIAVRNALKAAASLPDARTRCTAFAALCAGSLALTVRPDVRNAARTGALRSLFADALGALSTGTSQKLVLKQLLLSLLQAASGDATPGHACYRGTAWPLAALETLELGAAGLGLELPGGDIGGHDTPSTVVFHAYIALLAKLAPTAAAVGGEAAQRTQTVLRGCVASVNRRCIAAQETASAAAAGALCPVAAACSAVFAQACEPIAPGDVRGFCECVALSVTLATASIKARAAAAAATALHDGSIATAAAACASADAARHDVGDVLLMSLRASTIFLARCRGVEARMDAASQLKRALAPLSEVKAAADPSPQVTDCLASVLFDIAAAERGDPADEGLEAAVAQSTPLPPAVSASVATHERQLRAAVVSGLAAAGIHVDDAPAHVTRRLGPQPPHAALSPQVRVSAGSDPYSVAMSHVHSAAAGRLSLTIHITNVAASPPGCDLSLTLALGGALVATDGSPCVAVAPLHLFTLARDSTSPPPSVSAATAAPGDLHCIRSFDLALTSFSPAVVTAQLAISDRGGASTLRCAPYRIPLTHQLVPWALSPAAFMALWSDLDARCSACIAPRRNHAMSWSSGPGPRAQVALSKHALGALVSACDAASPPWSRAAAAAVPDANDVLPGAGRAAYAAMTWRGDAVLVLATSAADSCAHVETRSPAREVIDAISADMDGWMHDLTAGACTVVHDAGAAGDQLDDVAIPRAESDFGSDAEEDYRGHAPAVPAAQAPEMMLFSP